MAFCTSCGATVGEQEKYCAKCGAALASGFTPAAGSPARAAAPGSPAQPASSGGGSGLLKAVVIIIGAFLLLGIIGMAVLGYVGYRTAKAIKEASKNVAVETATSEADVKRIVEGLGVEVYPGATYKRGGGSAVALGGMKVAGATFETSDPAAQVAEWYKTKYPNAMSAETQTSKTLTFSKDKAWITIGIQEAEGKTEITISSLEGGKGAPTAPAPATPE